MPLVGVLIGSKSDAGIIEGTTSVLEELGISYEVLVMSAHRNPAKVEDYATSAEKNGIEIIIAGAGGSAALPGVIASWTHLPVIGIPIASSELKGVDSLYSISQMPPGMPVACMAIGMWGAKNAAYMAASILSLNHDEVKKSYLAYRRNLSQG